MIRIPGYRMMYEKVGPARFISHLDLLRTFGRAARRAGLPLAFTQGFNPHPKITFAAPLAVGISGEAEFADLELTEKIPAPFVARALSDALPEGLRVLEVRQLKGAGPALMAMVRSASYRVEAKTCGPVTAGELKDALGSFLSRQEILVERKNNEGKKVLYDLRPGIFVMSGRLDNDIIKIEAELKTGSSGNVRIEEVLEAFLKSSRLPVQGGYALFRNNLYTVAGKEKKMLWQT
ncbi:MAG: TIGR03936 family radical SAM-associated protein [Pelotomaculaceae bacterium]